MELKIVTWNVNGIRARAAQVTELLETERPDIVCLQEVKASPHDVPEPLIQSPNYWAHWHGHKGYSGVALLIRKDATKVTPEFTHPHFDFENRVVTAEMERIVFASVYVPNG